MPYGHSSSVMDIRELEQFLAVLDHGSILGAAEAQGLAQPALSRRMRALEQSLGVPLLDRSARGVTATVYGALLERHARLVLRSRERAIDELRSFRDGIEGHARVGVGPAFASLLPRAIEDVSARRPGLTFDVIHGTFDALVRGLRVGEIDGAFTLIASGESHKGLEVRPLVRDEVLVLCNGQHPLRRKRKLRLAELANERWALMNRPRSVIETFQRVAAERGLEAPHIAVETNSLDLIKSLVIRGSFLSVLPRGAVLADLEEGRAAALAVEDLPEVMSGFLHRNEILPPAVDLLLDEVGSQLRSR